MAEKSGNPTGRWDRPPVIQQLVAIPRRRGARFWTPWLITAGMAIAAITLAVQYAGLSDQLLDESRMVTNLAAKASHAQQLSEVLTSPSAQRATLSSGKPSTEPVGHAIYLPNVGSLIFDASNLQPLPEDKTYELWIMPADGNAPIPAGLFHPDAKGMASVVLPKLPAGVPAKGFSVTAENSGGASTPTQPFLLSGSVPSA